MRCKKAECQRVDNKYLCTGCMTRYDGWELAIKCVSGHNQKIYEEIDRFDKFLKMKVINPIDLKDRRVLTV